MPKSQSFATTFWHIQSYYVRYPGLKFITSDSIYPFLIVQIPPYGLLDAFLELKGRLPSKLTVQLT